MPAALSLDIIQVASPCEADWNAMTGDARVRHCDACQKNVYNLSRMTRAQAEALILQKEGKLCVRFYRRADGTMLTADCPVGVWHAAHRRVSVWLASAAAVLVGLVAVGIGMTRSGGSESELEELEALSPMDDSLRCVMGDVELLPVPGNIPEPPKPANLDP